MTQSAPVVDTDPPEPDPVVKPAAAGQPAPGLPADAQLNIDKARLDVLLKQYTPAHPDVRRLKKKIEDEEAQDCVHRDSVHSGCGPCPAASANENDSRSGSTESTCK